MKFIVVGINHELLNQDQRKHFYFHESDKLAFLSLLVDKNINQSLILNTCNRSEVYVVVADDFDEQLLVKEYLAYFKQPETDLLLKINDEALKHLLALVCGLKSMVIGEDQIVNQIKDSLNFTMEHHFGGKMLYYIFQESLAFGKKIKNQYPLNDKPLSISYIGYQIIRQYLVPGDIIMICGSGEMAQLMLKYLSDYQIYLVNRRLNKVSHLLNDHVTYIPFEKRYDYVAKAKIIISATSSPHLVFNQEKMNQLSDKIFLDLAMPRDIDLRLKSQHLLIDLDALQTKANQYLQARYQIAGAIEAKIIDQLLVMKSHLALMKNDSVIEQMQHYYLDLSNETYQLLSRKLTLTPHEDYVLKKVLKTQFLRLMKEPLRLLKDQELDVDLYLDFIQRIINHKEK